MPEKKEELKPVEPKKAARFSGGCESVNMQHYGTDGKLEELKCDLPAGHEGDHHAASKRNVSDPVVNDKGQVVQQRYIVEDAEAWWNNAAQKVVPKEPAKELPQMTAFQRDLVQDILRMNPEMGVEAAIAEAKASPAWNAVS